MVQPSVSLWGLWCSNSIGLLVMCCKLACAGLSEALSTADFVMPAWQALTSLTSQKNVEDSIWLCPSISSTSFVKLPECLASTCRLCWTDDRIRANRIRGATCCGCLFVDPARPLLHVSSEIAHLRQRAAVFFADYTGCQKLRISRAKLQDVNSVCCSCQFGQGTFIWPEIWII